MRLCTSFNRFFNCYISNLTFSYIHSCSHRGKFTHFRNMPTTDAEITNKKGTIAERVIARSKATQVTDFFGKKRGPKKKYANKKNKARKVGKKKVIEVILSSSSDSSSDDESSNQSPDNQNPQQPEFFGFGRSHRLKWSSPQYFPILKQAIKDKRRLGKQYKPDNSKNGIFIPRTTLTSVIGRLGNKPITIENCFPNQKNLF